MRRASSGEELSRAKNAALRLLKCRARSEREIRERLRQKNFSSSVSGEVIKSLKASGLLDDEKFADDWIRQQIEKKRGPRKIAYDLLRFGIEKTIIDRRLKEITAALNPRETIEEQARLRMEKYRHVEKEKAISRTYRYLVYRGFEPAIVEEVLQSL